MFQNRVSGRKSGGLILAGLAAFAYYKYSKMSEADKTNLSQTIRQKGEELLNQFVPGVFGNKESAGATTAANGATYTGSEPTPPPAPGATY